MEHTVGIIHRLLLILYCEIHSGRMMSFYGLGCRAADLPVAGTRWDTSQVQPFTGVVQPPTAALWLLTAAAVVRENNPQIHLGHLRWLFFTYWLGPNPLFILPSYSLPPGQLAPSHSVGKGFEFGCQGRACGSIIRWGFAEHSDPVWSETIEVM